MAFPESQEAAGESDFCGLWGAGRSAPAQGWPAGGGEPGPDETIFQSRRSWPETKICSDGRDQKIAAGNFR